MNGKSERHYNPQNYSVVHLTSVHSRYDTRIFLKECHSLAAEGYSVTLVVADGQGNETKDGIRIIDAGYPPGRISRVLKTTTRIFRIAKSLNADMIHLHDPELIPVGIFLKNAGTAVVFDSHEDLPKQILGKHYLGPARKLLFSKIATLMERSLCPRFDAVICATPAIAHKFKTINSTVVILNNYPIVDELHLPKKTSQNSEPSVICYIGGIGVPRGIREMTRAMSFVKSNVVLHIAGGFSDSAIEEELHAYNGWKHVEYLGTLNRLQLAKLLQKSIAGLVLFHALPNHIDAQPNKMFEYMSAGIPVIASNFPLWKEIVERNNCGVCVSPDNPIAIANAIDSLVNDLPRATRLGNNGISAIAQKYNWGIEKSQLTSIYRTILA